MSAGSADVIHGKDYDPRKWDTFAKANQNIADQQPSHRRVEFAQTAPKIPTLGWGRGVVDFLLLFAQLTESDKSDDGE